MIVPHEEHRSVDEKGARLRPRQNDWELSGEFAALEVDDTIEMEAGALSGEEIGSFFSVAGFEEFSRNVHMTTEVGVQEDIEEIIPRVFEEAKGLFL